MRLYYASGSPFAWRAQLALEEKGIGYEKTLLSFQAGDLQKPEYLAISPHGKVPALTDGDVSLYESHAIVEYLEERHPKPALLPTDPAARARTRIEELEATLYSGDACRRAGLRGIAVEDGGHDQAGLRDRGLERVRKRQSLRGVGPGAVHEHAGAMSQTALLRARLDLRRTHADAHLRRGFQADVVHVQHGDLRTTPRRLRWSEHTVQDGDLRGAIREADASLTASSSPRRVAMLSPVVPMRAAMYERLFLSAANSDGDSCHD